MKKNNLRKLIAIFSLQACMALIFLFFGNCSPEHKSSDSSSTSATKIVFGNCSLTGPQQLFELTYHPILRQQCLNCHSPNPPMQDSQKYFASSNLTQAYEAFNNAGGYVRISEYAVNESHKSPFTGSHNIAAINEAKNLWNLGNQELAKCASNSVEEFVNDSWKAVRVYSKPKAINPKTTGPSIVSWDLNTDIRLIPNTVTWPNLYGARFQLKVNPTFIGSVASYTISEPRIIYPTQINPQAVDINLKSIRVSIDEVEIINETTFHYVDANVYKNVGGLLSAGAMVAVRSVRLSDVISVSFGEVKSVVLPPPPEKPTVQFSTASSLNTTESGRVTINLKLSKPVDSFVSVGYKIEPAITNGATPECCTQITDSSGATVQIKKFDRDYMNTVKDGFTAVFDPGVTSLNLEYDIYADQRDEPNESFVITLDNISIGNETGVIGSQNKHTVSINDNDSPPGPTEVTFTKIMKPGGAFAVHCIKCHHADNQDVVAREYDMTSYSDLISRNRVVPYKPESSILWWRIQGYDNLNNPVEQMPQGGLFDTDDDKSYSDILNWIKSGAKNN